MPVRKNKRIIIVLACTILAGLWSYAVRSDFQGPVKLPDFSGIYYSSRCVMHHVDPYSSSAYLNELRAENPAFLNGLLAALKRTGVHAALVYPPTALLAAIPLAILPWPIATNLFTIFTAGFLGLAAFLMWDLGGDFGPVLCGCFAGIMLADCVVVLILGNPAGIVVGCCIVSAWCLLKGRYAPAGVMLLALSLIVKPHDGGFVWLYFLLAGGALRKRALQTLAVAGVLAICAVVWIAPVSPHWMQEEHNAIATAAIRGGLNDPAPSGLTFRTHRAPILSLQVAFSIFRNDPHFYNPAAYLIVGVLMLVWAAVVLRKPVTREGSLLVLAAISILTMLPVYHRPYDAKLLLLTIPACALLWARRGKMRWVAFGLTSAAILVTSDLPLLFWAAATRGVSASTATLGGNLKLLLLQPAPVVLLAAGCFYLWVYIHYKPPAAQSVADRKAAAGSAVEAAAT